MSSFRKAVPLWHEKGWGQKFLKLLIKVKINCHEKLQQYLNSNLKTAETTQYTNQTYLTVLAEEHQQQGRGWGGGRQKYHQLKHFKPVI